MKAQFAEAVRRGFFPDSAEGRDSFAYWISGAGKASLFALAGQGNDWAYQWWVFLNWWNNRNTGLSGQSWASTQTQQGFFIYNHLSAAKLADAVKTVWGQSVSISQPVAPTTTSVPFNQGQLPTAGFPSLTVTQVVVDEASVSPGVYPALAKRTITINSGTRQQLSATMWVRASGNIPASSATDTFEIYWLKGIERDINNGTVTKAWYDWDGLMRCLGLSSSASTGGGDWFGKPSSGGPPSSGAGSPQVNFPAPANPSGGGSLTPNSGSTGDGAIQTNSPPSGVATAGVGGGLLGLIAIGAIVGMAMKKKGRVA